MVTSGVLWLCSSLVVCVVAVFTVTSDVVCCGCVHRYQWCAVAVFIVTSGVAVDMVGKLPARSWWDGEHRTYK